MNLQESTNAEWIWLPSWKRSDDEEPSFALFRKTIFLDKTLNECKIKISADSRYKLYINGKIIEVGPAKGDLQVWYYDEIDVASYLTCGENVFSVIVLRYPLNKDKGNHSVFRTATPGLYISCEDLNGHDKTDIGTNESWKCKKDDSIRIVSENPFFAPLQIYEKASGSMDRFGWMSSGFNDANWENAKCYCPHGIADSLHTGSLMPRPIPFMRRTERNFSGVSKFNGSLKELDMWEAFLANKSSVVIPAHTNMSIDLSAGELTTGYLKLMMNGGTGAQITILQAECYAMPPRSRIASFDNHPVKGNRTDSKNGDLFGYTDEYVVAGLGKGDTPEIYEPFWLRTFRFVRLSIKTGAEAIELCRFHYEETGYPLEVKTTVKTSDASLEEIWDISERTLKRCMHETYEDCPFYEQLQYAMDSRNQILYTYAVSADDRLARRCMNDFKRAKRYDGILNCSYPNYVTNVIPGFSIYYIGMLMDHMMYFGDREFIREHISTVDEILEYFHRNLCELGIVGKTGGLNRPGNYWSFIDWTPEWNETNGVPSAMKQGPITMESFLYLLGLQYAGRLNEYIGRPEMADKYQMRADALQQAIKRHCVDENGVFEDGPGVREYSQHCQVFAVLTDTVSREQGKVLLKKTLTNKSDFAQCSVAMAFYLFRALEKCNLYEKTYHLWDIWRDMLNNHMTTCAEDPLSSRSDCHAWGSLALYELPSVILGVRPLKPGYEEIEINPTPGMLTWAEGTVVTPKGDVYVKWEKKEDGLQLEVKCDSELKIVMPSTNEVI